MTATPKGKGNDAMTTLNVTATNETAINETAAHIAAAKAKLALAAAKKAAKDAIDALAAEKEAVKKAKMEAAELADSSAAKHAELVAIAKADIVKMDADHVAFLSEITGEHNAAVIARLAASGLTMEDVSLKSRVKRDPKPTRVLPTTWLKGVSIDASGNVCDADSDDAIYVIGQIGRTPFALASAYDAAMARQNANA
jgi:hypothetical protein